MKSLAIIMGFLFGTIILLWPHIMEMLREEHFTYLLAQAKGSPVSFTLQPPDLTGPWYQFGCWVLAALMILGCLWELRKIK